MMSKLKSFFLKSKKRAYGLLALALVLTGTVGTMAIFSDHIGARMYLTIAAWKGEPVIRQWVEEADTDFHAYKETVSSITFLQTYDENATMTAGPWDVSRAKDKSVMAYMNGTDVYICANVGEAAKIIANPYSSYAYCHFNALESISGEDNMNTEHAITMEGMFKDTGGFSETSPELDLRSWNTAKVGSMKSMFESSRFKAIDVSKLNTSAVEDMSFTFAYVYKSDLTTLDISNWDVSNVKTMESMFDTSLYSTPLTLDVSKWNTKNVENMNNMFQYGEKLNTLDVSGWDVGSLETAENMFFGCTRLTSLGAKGLSEWNTNSLTNTTSMFENCDDLPVADISNWNMSKITKSDKMFAGCASLTELSIPATYKNVGNHFAAYCTSLDTITFGHTNVNQINFPDAGAETGAFYLEDYLATTVNSTVADIKYGYDWFTDNRREAPVLAPTDSWHRTWGDYDYTTPIDEENLETIEIRDYYMPDGTETSWDASDPSAPGTVTAYLSADKKTLTVAGNGYGLLFANEDSSYAFAYLSNVTTISNMDLLDTRNVTTMESMFEDCYLLKDVDVHSFNTSKVTNISYMFDACYSLETMDFSTQTDVPYKRGTGTYTAWDTSSLQNACFFLNMYSAPFEDATYSLTSVDVTGWDTSMLEWPDRMFMCNYNLTEIKGIEDWDMSAATTFEFLFYACSSLESVDVSEWTTTNVESTRGMFNSCAALKSIDISKWDMSNVTETRDMFIYCENLTELTLPSTLSVIGREFAARCPKLTTITFLQPADMEITFYDGDGCFMVYDNGDDENPVTYSQSNPLRTKVVTSNQNVLEYDWTYDHRGYKVTVIDKDGGTLTATPSVAINGVTIQTSADADSGYKFEGANVSYTDESGNKQKILLGSSSTNSFTMPVGDVTIEPRWVQPIPILAEQYYWYTQGSPTISKDKITSITFVDEYDPAGKTIVDQWNASHIENIGPSTNYEEGNVTAYVEDDGLLDSEGNDTGTYKLTLAGSGVGYILANENSNQAFSGFSSVTSITGLELLDTRNVTDMSSMFSNNKKLVSLDVSTFDTRNVTNMSDMFDNCNDLQMLDIRSKEVTLNGNSYDSWDTRNVSNMASMFDGCYDLLTLDISHFDTQWVTDMHDMFSDCMSMTALDIQTEKLSLNDRPFDSWDTGNATNMDDMFGGLMAIDTLDVSHFDTRNVENMYKMFRGCVKMTSLNIGTKELMLNNRPVNTWDTGNVTTMGDMFAYDGKVSELDLSGFNTAMVETMNYMFMDCSTLTTIYASDNWSTKSLSSNGYGMFLNCSKLKGDIAYNGTSDQTYAKIHDGYLTYKGKISVTYDANGGTFADGSEQNTVRYLRVRDTSTIISGDELIPEHSETARAFEGWYTSEDVLFDLGSTTSNITVYAKWSVGGPVLIESWDVSYNQDGSVMANLYSAAPADAVMTLSDDDPVYDLVIEGTGKMMNWSSSATSDFHADEYKTYIRSVTIGDGVTSIGTYAFYNTIALTEINFNAVACTNLSSNNYTFAYSGVAGDGITVIFGNNVTKIPAYLFNPYSNSTSYVPNITSVTIGEGVTTIGQSAFNSLLNLREINFNAVACTDLSVGNYVFSKAGQSGNGIAVTFGENVTKIPAYLFHPYSSSSYATKVTNVVVYNKTTSIGIYAFSLCPYLEYIWYVGNQTQWDAVSKGSNWDSGTGQDTSKGTYTVVYNGLKMTSQPDTTVYRVGSTFDPTGMVVKFLDGPNHTFNALTRDQYTISPEILSADDTVVTISYTDASENTYTESVPVIVGNETAILYSDGTMVFQSDNITDTSTHGEVIATYNCLWKENTFTSKYQVPWYSNMSKITNIIIEDDVAPVSTAYWFYDATNLESVTIGEGITSIGKYAFYNTTALTEINFNAVACVDLSSNNYVFSYAGQSDEGITVTFGENVTRIPGYLLYPYNQTHSPKVTNVTIGNQVSTIGTYAFAYCNMLTSVDIPNSVSTIESGAFYGWTSLTSVEIPDNVTSIGASAFYGCTSLTSITIGEGVTNIGKSAFQNTKALTEINFNAVVCDNLSSQNHVFSYAGQSGNGIAVTFGENVTQIPAYLFYPYTRTAYSPNITSVTVGSKVTSIGTYAFYGCSSLTDLYYLGSQTEWGSITKGSSWSSSSPTIHYDVEPATMSLRSNGGAVTGYTTNK